MGRFGKFMSSVADGLNAMAEHDAKVNELTYKLMSKTREVDFEQARKIAEVLILQAEITWK